MRFLVTAAASLLLAACASDPKPVATATRTPIAAPVESGILIGLDAAALLTRFGRPRLQVREGDGTKIQFAGGSCFLDAYLYPPQRGGVPRVTHIDTRNRDGRSVPQATCVAMISPR